ncbi:MAG: hypothetical protein BWY95_00176 [Bacteroidetes bacterium ADurb.BinA104]|nr:MAG: hypothetical protein BWY95_00176 [Bacteroidetes bacterium ADurb.BinA104]
MNRAKSNEFHSGNALKRARDKQDLARASAPNFKTQTKFESGVLVAEVMSAAEYGLASTPIGYAFCRLLGGPDLRPVYEITFMARLPSDSISYNVGTRVFVLNDKSHGLLIISSLDSGSSSTGILFQRHSHQGYYDGGYAGFLSGSY